jgi:prepilin-type N-terminal cleavage/methylation domain-containing protein
MPRPDCCTAHAPRSADRAGFSMVEMLIVIVILGILGMIVLPLFQTASDDAREAALAQNLCSMRKFLATYRSSFKGSYPKTKEELQAAVGVLPKNPYTSGRGVRIIQDLNDSKPNENEKLGAEKVGWIYHPPSGTMIPNNEGMGSDGRPLNQF